MLKPVSPDASRAAPAGVGGGVRILVMAAGRDYAGPVRRFLAEQRMVVTAPPDEGALIAMAANGGADLILLDAALPRLNGLEVLRLIRARCDTPVIVLTEAAAPERIAALEAGADDCLSAPFDYRELVARVRAVLRRRGRNARPDPMQIRSVRIDPGSRDVWARGRKVELTSAEYVILETLMRAAGRVVTREFLAWTLRQRQSGVLDRSLDVHMAHLRNKLGRPSQIRTVRGEGYFFCCEPAE